MREGATLPQRTRIVFSDLDGTLVHFERHFSSDGSVVNIDQATNTAVYRSIRGSSEGAERNCRLLPTSTMGPGLFSDKSAELIGKLRDAGVVFVYVTGARKSTMIDRLPLLAPADFAVAETGGRMYITNGSTSQTPPLDPEWTARIERECGPIEPQSSIPEPHERKGSLWDWYRELTARGIKCDTRNYTCCFRVNAADKEAELRDAIAEALPANVECAQNLGKFDFFPKISGKGKAVEYLLDKLGIDKDDAVALFDDENDLPMAEACGHACVMRCTHASISARLPDNPHWHVASEAGVLATEEILQMILDKTTKST